MNCPVNPALGIGCGLETCSNYQWDTSVCYYPSAYYQDADGDGYGNQDQVAYLCGPESGWVTNSGDCDDTKASLHVFNFGPTGAPSSCTHAFTDGWASNSSFWSCPRPNDYDTAPGSNGDPYRFDFNLSQSGNVATDGTVVASICCSNDAVTSTGVCTDITAAEFAAHATLSLTCPGNPSMVYFKRANGGGGCCGGYTRTIGAIDYTNYTGCDP